MGRTKFGGRDKCMLGKDRDLMLDMKPGGILVGWAPCLITLAEENLSIRQNYRACSVQRLKSRYEILNIHHLC